MGEIRMVKEKDIKVKKDLIRVGVTEWKGGMGHGRLGVICPDINSALLVKEGLRKVFPDSINVERGDEKIVRRYVINVEHVFDSEAIEYIEDKW